MTDRPVQQAIDGYWDRRADSYHEFQETRMAIPEIRSTWAAVWAEALPAPPATVLDVGCGTGHVAMLLTEEGYEVVGLDASPAMVERAKRTAAAMDRPPRFEVADAVDPGQRHNDVDAITCRYLLWTLREPTRALTAWRRLLRPGGRLAAVDAIWFPDGLDAGPGGPWDFADAYDDRVAAELPLAAATTMDDAVEVVRAAGWVDVEIRPLQQLVDLDERYGVAPDHTVRLQYLITATAP